jgi:hypothetical protein
MLAYPPPVFKHAEAPARRGPAPRRRRARLEQTVFSSYNPLEDFGAVNVIEIEEEVE